MSACCGRRDTNTNDTVVAKIAAAGLAVPAGSRLRRGGPHGWRWQLADRSGRPLSPPVGSSCPASAIAATAAVRVYPLGADGARHVHGAEQCGWG